MSHSEVTSCSQQYMKRTQVQVTGQIVRPSTSVPLCQQQWPAVKRVHRRKVYSQLQKARCSGEGKTHVSLPF
jgi:hypothetical protein